MDQEISIEPKSGPNVSTSIWTLPNQLTAIRLGLSIAVFVLIEYHFYAAAAVVFIFAASTDWLDGYLARKYNLVSTFGRVFDPFVDKIIICGAFIMLAAEPASGMAAWMAVVVVGRELLVTAIRSHIEGQGGDFSANMAGKLKMVFQCAAVVASLAALSAYPEPRPAWVYWLLTTCVWLAVLSTIYSGAIYVVAGVKTLR